MLCSAELILRAYRSGYALPHVRFGDIQCCLRDRILIERCDVVAAGIESPVSEVSGELNIEGPAFTRVPLHPATEILLSSNVLARTVISTRHEHLASLCF